MGAETATLLGTLPEQASITLGRFAEAEEVADLVLFLSSERASAVTGSEYMIDGGTLKIT